MQRFLTLMVGALLMSSVYAEDAPLPFDDPSSMPPPGQVHKVMAPAHHATRSQTHAAAKPAATHDNSKAQPAAKLHGKAGKPSQGKSARHGTSKRKPQGKQPAHAQSHKSAKAAPGHGKPAHKPAPPRHHKK